MRIPFVPVIVACAALAGCAHTPPVPLRHNTPRPGAHSGILWTDDIQNSCGEAPYGFSQIQLERPIGQSVGGSDEVDLYRTNNPDGGAGYALKHVATFDNGGSRSQAGIYSFANAAFDQQVRRAEGVWIAAEWYFPAVITAKSGLDSAPWVNLWDFHSVGPSERWDTQPGIMLAEDGSMKVKFNWRAENQDTAWSSVPLPVGRWFDVEMHYVWSSSCATITFWVDGQVVLEQQGVKTKGQNHNSVETYMKFYGSANSGTAWTPSPSVKYMRNVRIAGQRIWH
jgi:hypothetical protein